MAKGYTDSVARLIELLTQMPGVGVRTAERLVYHILRIPRGEAEDLANAVREVRQKVRQCSTCHLFCEADVCEICADSRRDRAAICVVEESRDVLTIEQGGTYRGIYHVLCGRLAPLDGVEPEDLTVAHLLERVAAGEVKEVILATDPDMEGEATALYVRQALEGLPVKVTRLARGIPTGSQLEYANADIVADALEGRREMEG